MQTRTVRLHGKDFFLREWGEEGQPIILALHGFPEYGGAWSDLAPFLSGYRVVAPDQRGYGQSWTPDAVEDYAMKHLVSDMAELITQIGSPVILLGHDWGASAAYALSIFRPELIEKLIIMNGVHPAPFQRALAAGGAQTAASQYITWLRASGSEGPLSKNNFDKLEHMFSKNMGMGWFNGDTAAAYKAEWARPGRIKGMVNWYRASPLVVPPTGQKVDVPEFSREKLAVTMPHLLIWGQNDTALLPEATEGLEDFCSDLTRVDVPGADHWLHHQKPQEVAQIILEWLAR